MITFFLERYHSQETCVMRRRLVGVDGRLEAAFEFFGGVPAELLFDQMKAVIEDEWPSGGRLLENAEFVRFAAAAGRLARRLAVLTHPSLLVVDEIGYLPISHSGAVLSSGS